MRAWRMRSMSCVARRHFPFTMMPRAYLATESAPKSKRRRRLWCAQARPFHSRTRHRRCGCRRAAVLKRRGRNCALVPTISGAPRASSARCEKPLRRERERRMPNLSLCYLCVSSIRQRSVGRDALDPYPPEHSTATALSASDLPPVFSEMHLETTSDYDLLRRLGNL